MRKQEEHLPVLWLMFPCSVLQVRSVLSIPDFLSLPKAYVPGRSFSTEGAFSSPSPSTAGNAGSLLLPFSRTFLGKSLPKCSFLVKWFQESGSQLLCVLNFPGHKILPLSLSLIFDNVLSPPSKAPKGYKLWEKSKSD